MKLNKEQQDAVRRFFAYARERHQIYVNRHALGREPPWTKDPILQQYRFTNVFRELDRTTIWFKNNVRDEYGERPEGLLAVVLFRWFNRIETGETLFCQPNLFGNMTPFEEYLETGKKSVLRRALKKQGPPYTTGSYIINTHGPLGTGYSKLDGVLNQFHAFAKREWRAYAKKLLREDVPLQEIHTWLMKDTLGLGDFMAYEIVSDLRWMNHARTAPDIMTWANPGLGAQRGAGRILGIGTKVTRKGKTRAKRLSNEESLDLMRYLISRAGIVRYWPAKWHAWEWEMREVEHTLCEFDKYERTRLGMGRPRGKFNPGEAQ